jgi:peptidoglycan/LPS O-acetylase OafA/YrhL
VNDYRADIDGLRALAILPVIFFHAGLGALSGGFVGVDIFFVISGYLITVIILQNQKHGFSSILQFYERRLRRIVPALMTVVLSCCIAAWVLLPPDQMTAFGKTVLSLPVFGSNILFWKQSGYFEAPAQTVPLLHTWSLAVEEQFYAVFPIGILLIRRFGGSRYSFWLGLVATISLGISIWGVEHRPTATFYLAPTRAWELLLGSLIALGAFPKLKNRTIRDGLSIIALGLIVWPTLAYSDATRFPGLAALPPTIGAAILIHAGTCGDSVIKRVLGWKPLVGVGLISYSLYLWHWPLIVFAQQVSPFPLGEAEKWTLLVLAAVLASLTWAFIEIPFRRKAVLSRRGPLMSAAGVSACCLAGFSILVIRWEGIPQRIDAAIRPTVLANIAIKTTWAYPNECKANYRRKLGPQDSITYCPIGGAGPSTVLFWGDSQVEQLFPLLSNLAKDGSFPGKKIMAVTSGGCLPVVGLNRLDAGFDCDGFNRRVIDRAVQPDIDTVVLGSAPYSWSGLCKTESGCSGFNNRHEFLDFLGRNLRNELKQLAGSGKKLVILKPFPAYPVSIPEYLNKQIMFGREPMLRLTRREHLRSVADFASVWQDAAGAVNATVVDPSAVLCPSNECVYRRGFVALYIDGGHFGADLAESLRPVLLAALENNQSQEAADGCSVRRVAIAGDLIEADQGEDQCNSR